MKTDTTRFILPMLYHIEYKNDRLFKYNSNFFISDNFINAYIGDVNKPVADYQILLVYKLEQSYMFNYMEEYMIKHPLYVDDYTYGNKYVVYIFKVQTEDMVDFNIIKSSHYSKVREEYKSRILDFWALKGHNLVYSLLYRTDLIKEKLSLLDEKQLDNLAPGEDWFKFTHNNEYLNIEFIKGDK